MKPLRTALVGLGKIGAGYAHDPVMARHIQFATHAQVLDSHPEFEWVGAVDTDELARAEARRRWPDIPVASSPAGICPDVAVLATGPASRLNVLAELPTVRAVIVEKPLGRDAAEARRFLDVCEERAIAVQVCYWRRADSAFRALAEGGLEHAIGRPQAATVVYGNGLRNNGSHMIDFVRMLVGEVTGAWVPPGVAPYREGPLESDVNVSFHLTANGVPVAVHPLRFAHYRENALEVWGERGRLTVVQEGLRIRVMSSAPNRAMQGEREINSDAVREIPSTVGNALYELYSNVANALAGGGPLWSDGESALRTEAVVDEVATAAAACEASAPELRPSAKVT
jgi:predicted dehydrogenase